MGSSFSTCLDSPDGRKSKRNGKSTFYPDDTENEELTNNPKNKNSAKPNSVNTDNSQATSSKRTRRPNKNNNFSKTKNYHKPNANMSSAPKKPPVETSKPDLPETPMDVEGITNSNIASEDKAEWESASEISSENKKKIKMETHSDSQYNQAKNSADKPKTQNEQGSHKKKYLNTLEHQNEPPIHSNYKQPLQSQSFMSSGDHLADNMEKALNELKKHNQSRSESLFEDGNEGAVASECMSMPKEARHAQDETITEERDTPCFENNKGGGLINDELSKFEKNFTMKTEQPEDQQKTLQNVDSLENSQEMQKEIQGFENENEFSNTYSADKNFNQNENNNEKRTETIGVQTIGKRQVLNKPSYGKDDHLPNIHSSQSEETTRFDERQHDKTKEFDEHQHDETKRSTQASRNRSPHEEQKQVQVTEEPLQILDVHQFFRDDIDLNSLDSLENSERIKQISSYAKTFETKVNEFSEEKYSLQYFVLDEKLMRLIEKLDRIKCHGDYSLTEKKVQVIEYIKKLHATLDERAKEEQ